MIKSLCNVMVGSDETGIGCSLYAVIAGLYVLFDVAYYLRGVCTAVVWAIYFRLTKSLSSKSAQVLRDNLLSPSFTWGICWFTDLDLMFHMNNARYLRECDFARYKFLISCGLGAALRKTGLTMVLGASTIRYRRSIGLLGRFQVATRVLAWDEKSLYIEHRFLRFTDDFVCAIVLVKQSLVGGSINDLFKAALSPANDEAVVSPAIPEELSKWIECNDASSRRLNPERRPDAPVDAVLGQTPPTRIILKGSAASLEKENPAENGADGSSDPEVRLRRVTREKRDTLTKDTFIRFYSLAPSRSEVAEDEREDDGSPQRRYVEIDTAVASPPPTSGGDALSRPPFSVTSANEDGTRFELGGFPAVSQSSGVKDQSAESFSNCDDYLEDDLFEAECARLSPALLQGCGKRVSSRRLPRSNPSIASPELSILPREAEALISRSTGPPRPTGPTNASSASTCRLLADGSVQTSFLSYPEMETDEVEILRSGASSGRRSAVAPPGFSSHLSAESSIRLRGTSTLPSGEGCPSSTLSRGGHLRSDGRVGSIKSSGKDPGQGGRIEAVKALWTPTGLTVRRDMNESLDRNNNSSEMWENQ